MIASSKMREILWLRFPVSGAKTIAISGRAGHSAAVLELGAVVVMLTVTTELPLPDGTCAGLKLHEANAGRPEHVRLTLFGKVRGLGFTVTVNNAVLPRATAAVGGVAEIEKVKIGVDIVVKLSATACLMAAVSLPTASRSKEYACAVGLLTATVNETPVLSGTRADGFTVQVGGAPVPQLNATLLLYPFTPLITPSYVAVVFT
jgi:hypothetical protein